MSTPEKLLDALSQVIDENGPSGVTLRKVGTTAGLSHTAAAHYYKDKAGLFTAYIARAWNQLAEQLEANTDGLEPRAALLATADTYATFALAEPSSFSVMSRMELTNVDTPELWAARERSFFLVFALVEKLQATGWGKGRETLDLMATTWAMVHGFVDLWVGGPLWAPYDGNDLRPTLQRLVSYLIDDMAD